MTIAEMIEYLKTYPQSMEVWKTWDESGECWPASKLGIGSIRRVVRRRVNGKMRWEESFNDKGKEVFFF